MTKTTKDDPKVPSNMRLWDQLGKTDPNETKPITGGRFKGTAIKPMWINKRLTETFGPAGIGWGMDAPEFQIVHSQEGQVLVYCTVKTWYKENQLQHFVYGVGGDFAVKKDKNGLFHDDEAFKKAYTDALNNAWKFIGVAADVHMGLFDDNKYVQDLKREIEKAKDTLGPQVDDLVEALNLCSDSDELPELKKRLLELGQALVDVSREGEAQMLTQVWKTTVDRLSPTKAEPADEPAK